ncbi:hypothetical protein D3C74_469220 [compost metagenome]
MIDDSAPMELPPKPQKRHTWQLHPDKHADYQALEDDYDSFNLICDLYDMGVDIKMIRKAFKEIEKERARDYADDVSALESHLRSGIYGG